MEDNHHDLKKQRKSMKIIGTKHERKSKIKSSSTTMTTHHEIGLRIVAHISSSSSPISSIDHKNQKPYSNKNVVFKSSLRLRQPDKKSSAIEYSSCFLKTCNLCNKALSLDKEIYMYRGDQGFCSKECRNRQIYLDEKRELEDSTKKMVAAYRSSCKSRSTETGSILEDLIHSRETYMNNNNQHRRNNNRAVFIF